MTELIAARRRMAIFLGLFLFVVVLLTSQARSPDRRQGGAIGTGVLTLLMPVQVDRGSRDGVRRNAPVVTADGVVGRVIEVTLTTSRVLLIVDSRSAVGALVQRSRDLAVVEGRSERVLHLKYLSRTAQVEPGDLVVTSGQGGVFPKGLVVGRITRVVQEEGEYLQEAQVEPAAALDRLEEVLILLSR